MRKDRGGVSRQRMNPILSRVADDAATGDAPATGPAPVGFCLAAGAGTRLRPLTGQVPKPLLAPAGRPLVDLACEALDRAGTREIVVNTHHGASQLAAHLDGRPGLHVLHEPELLGTGGALGNAYHLGLLGGGTVLVTSADVLVHPADLASVAAQLDRGGEVAIGLVPARPGRPAWSTRCSPRCGDAARSPGWSSSTHGPTPAPHTASWPPPRACSPAAGPTGSRPASSAAPARAARRSSSPRAPPPTPPRCSPARSCSTRAAASAPTPWSPGPCWHPARASATAPTSAAAASARAPPSRPRHASPPR